VNYHLLSDFRTGHGEFLDQLLTNMIATLLHRQIVTLETVAQDGMRVRAHAGSHSFRREPTLQACRQQAAAHFVEIAHLPAIEKLNSGETCLPYDCVHLWRSHG